MRHLDSGQHCFYPELTLLGSQDNSDHSRLAEHTRKEDFLSNLATLIGCSAGLGGMLPDGSRPDVLRVNPGTGYLFIGDAKNTETPKCQATQERLSVYLSWMSAYISAHQKGMFAICFGRETDTLDWIDTVDQLGEAVGIYFTHVGVENFGEDLILVWFVPTSII